AADDKSRHYLEVISSSARRMAALIDDLLVYSRLGRAAMRQQAVDMQSLVADTRAMLDANLQAEAENSGHAHHVELEHRAAADRGGRREHDPPGLAEPAR
ncbi:hypothetical protein AA979_15220, partial [Stenotrophomonas maltophilia]